MIWNCEKPLKILCIGNSFSVDTLAHAHSIAKDMGLKNVKFGNAQIGGCEVKTHAQHARNDANAYVFEINDNGNSQILEDYKLSEALAFDSWDIVSLQQASGFSGMEESYGDLDYLIGYVKERVSTNTKIVWNMTWAYQQDSTHPHFAHYNNSQEKMYKSIISVVKNVVLAKKDISAFSPAGTTVQNMRTSSLGDTITRDGFHLSFGLGRFASGLTFLHTLTGIEIEGVNFSIEGITEKEKQIAIKAAKAAVKNPFEITKINI